MSKFNYSLAADVSHCNTSSKKARNACWALEDKFFMALTDDRIGKKAYKRLSRDFFSKCTMEDKEVEAIPEDDSYPTFTWRDKRSNKTSEFFYLVAVGEKYEGRWYESYFHSKIEAEKKALELYNEYIDDDSSTYLVTDIVSFDD